ncbi:ATP-binding protein [Sphingosinicella sp. BN140058]|uniref:ATP-binding protein n=1 Tax=Sphingosinicella sp. BN140058 TaxID=1892855 RepID=UPI001011BE25|nr:ATP-binding protein [Sphingosinicella sp. BN140058]QAY79672.1 GAF domain-containing protein [Sphingosinicella sp. BN140058]
MTADLDRRSADGGLPADLEACAREPIHIPGTIQPQGALFVVRPDDLKIVQAALGPVARTLVSGSPLAIALDDLVRPERAPSCSELLREVPASGAVFLGTARLGSGAAPFHLIAHRSGGALIVELEEVEQADPGGFDAVQPLVQSFLTDLQAARTVAELGVLAAREVRRITGLDRVLVYRFDADGHGTVVAEDRNDRLPSYLDLRFPASDIPAQARELYRRNRLRLIADASYRPVPIEPPFDPATGAPVDLSLATLRSVSPVHLEYMRNMGTGASMSISLLSEGRLWGLISCHNREPHRVAYPVRTACEFIGQVLSLQIAAREIAALAERRIALRSVQSALLSQMALSESGFVDALLGNPDALLALTHAAGAAILFDGDCRTIGETPSQEAIGALADWLSDSFKGDIHATDALAAEMPAAEAFKDRGSGIMALSLSRVHRSYLIWFRPEVVRTVAWGGSPLKPAEPEGARIHPRKSFEVWKEIVQRRSLPWDEAEIDAATQLRSAIVDIILRSAEEMAQLNEQLVRSNRELEAFSYSVSHDLRAPFRHIVGYSELLKQNEGEHLSERARRYIDTIIESAVSAGGLVDDLLSFSQMGRATLKPILIDMNALAAEVQGRFEQDALGRTVRWRIADLPPAYADPGMLRLVLQNLVDNAIKFTRGRDETLIEIGADDGDDETVYFVRDNGAGFDMAYAGKLFGVFQRLHRVEEFEGTGIGLANVKRIVEQRHGGRVWAEGRIDVGATIFFALPKHRGNE